MRKLFLLLFSVLLLFSCKKDEADLKNQLQGVWEFENFAGYPFNNNFSPPGNGKVIVLYANGGFERRQHDTVLFKGKYYLKKQKDCHGTEKKILFTTNDPAMSIDRYIAIEDERLTLSTSNCYEDGGIAFYRKLQ